MAYLQNFTGVLKRSKVIVTWDDSIIYDDKLWTCWIPFYNAMFDWQICNFHLKASEKMPLANRDVQFKSGLHLWFIFLNWLVFSSETFTVCFLCQKPCRRNFVEVWSSIANVSCYHNATCSYNILLKFIKGKSDPGFNQFRKKSKHFQTKK